MGLIFIISFIFLLKCTGSIPTRFLFDADSDVINVEEAVGYLNNIKGRTWTAGSNNFGEYLSLSQQQHLMGSLSLESIIQVIPAQFPINSRTIVNGDNENRGENHIYTYDDLPDYYDARTMYPHCSTISSVKDQSLCGCCWAVAVASAFSDRLCIHSKGMINANISANHIMSCARAPGVNGCHGGWEHEGWNFIKDYGAVTGGDYGTFDGCQPFLIKPCGKKDQMPCELSNEVMTPICRQRKCSNEWYAPVGELYKVKSTWSMPGNKTHPNNEIDIRREIYRNGPVTAAFSVYSPFYFYRSGVFQMDFSNWSVPNGGHAVRIVGWGVDNNIPYWIIANSWGTNWGENGFFRMLRGKNYCNIESYINSGIPDVPQDI